MVRRDLKFITTVCKVYDLVHVKWISIAMPPNIYGYVKARAGRSQIIAAVINNINNSWSLLLQWTGSWAMVWRWRLAPPLTLASSDLVFYLWSDLCMVMGWPVTITLIAGAGRGWVTTLLSQQTLATDWGLSSRGWQETRTRGPGQPSQAFRQPRLATALYISEYKGAATVKFTSSEHNYIFANRIHTDLSST